MSSLDILPTPAPSNFASPTLKRTYSDLDDVVVNSSSQLPQGYDFKINEVHFV